MKQTKLDDGVKHLAIDEADLILTNWVEGVDAKYVNGFKDLRNYPVDQPVAFRGMTGRKIVKTCENQGREFYYIDTGYLGNREKRKIWHRVVRNGMQHSKVVWDLPEDRWKNIRLMNWKYNMMWPGWKKNGKAILVVTPSEKPCKYYGITRDAWVKETIDEIKKHTDRPIIVRDKGLRRERVGNGSLYNQLDEDHIFALVTYNSIAATEAVHYGVPAFTGAPGAADELCLKDLSKIETPYYADADKVQQWLHWLGYCQYQTSELKSGLAYKLIQEYGIA
tara:strand:+ start:5891 stop:6727 length:837 start_codon:yes stop_codon:yes gene_type:complete